MKKIAVVCFLSCLLVITNAFSHVFVNTVKPRAAPPAIIKATPVQFSSPKVVKIIPLQPVTPERQKIKEGVVNKTSDKRKIQIMEGQKVVCYSQNKQARYFHYLEKIPPGYTCKPVPPGMFNK